MRDKKSVTALLERGTFKLLPLILQEGWQLGEFLKRFNDLDVLESVFVIGP